MPAAPALYHGQTTFTTNPSFHQYHNSPTSQPPASPQLLFHHRITIQTSALKSHCKPLTTINPPSSHPLQSKPVPARHLLCFPFSCTCNHKLITASSQTPNPCSQSKFTTDHHRTQIQTKSQIQTKTRITAKSSSAQLLHSPCTSASPSPELLLPLTTAHHHDPSFNSPSQHHKPCLLHHHSRPVPPP